MDHAWLHSARSGLVFAVEVMLTSRRARTLWPKLDEELAATVRDVRDKLESPRSAIRRPKERAPRWMWRHAPRAIELSQPMISSVEPLSGTA